MSSTDPSRAATNVSTHGQVCDRCRQKKIKCDGISPSCTNCSIAGVRCDVSTQLRRKTKIRGYTTSSSSEPTERLLKEIDELRGQLQDERKNAQTLQSELDSMYDQMKSHERPSKIRKMNDHTTFPARASAGSPSAASELSTYHKPAHVIKHMGRMVFDHANVGRFAGSTTGVHFVASVEILCRKSWPSLEKFPEDCFRLYLVPFRSPETNARQSEVLEYLQTAPAGEKLTIKVLLDHNLQYYTEQLTIFGETWAALCPILPRDKFIQDIRQALTALRLDQALTGKISASLQTLIMIKLLNRHTHDQVYGQTEWLRERHDYLNMACELHPKIVAAGTLESLQALILFSLFLQISGQTSWLIQFNGIQVRLAQSLGLHRHARRFRMSESEIELRKQIWWWVYAFDKLSALVHGLPQLINDFDVDNDLPIDCELMDLTENGLTHPLPGERTPILLYIHYVHMCKLISAVLGQLYTTSQRRGGDEKIAAWDRNLRVWHQNFNIAFQLPQADVCDVERCLSKTRLHRFLADESFLVAWLDLMANYALILIHRPALTFSNQSTRFQESLVVCEQATSTLIQLGIASPLHLRALMSVPFGANVVFQSALMHVFSHCCAFPNGSNDENYQEKAVIDKAVHLLDEMGRLNSSRGFDSNQISKSIKLLESLSQLCNQSHRASTVEIPGVLQAGDDFTDIHQMTGNQPVEVIENQTENVVDVGAWNSSVLESLNQLDDFYNTWDSMTFFDMPNV